MRKILSVLAAMGLTSTAASAVVACGNKSNSEVGDKTDLSSVPAIKALESRLTITGSVGMTKDDAYALFSNISGVETVLKLVGLGKADFALELAVPTYDKDGSLKITVNKEESKYSGSLSVKISQFAKTTLDSLTGLTRTINGSADTSEDNVLNTFFAISGNEILKNEVEVKAGTFKAPGIGTEGLFTLEAISGDHKYTGEIDVTISGYTVALDSLPSLVKSIDGVADMTADDALQAFLAMDANKDLANEVEIKSGDESFVLPTSESEGKLIIAAREGSTKYTGEITITISELAAEQRNSFSKLFDKISDKLKIDGTAGMTEESAFTTFSKKLVVRPILFATRLGIADFTLKLQLPTTTDEGALTISVSVDNAKYTGSITVIINKLSAKANTLSTNDDHQSTVITLSTEDSLRLGYIKKDGDKYIAGDKLPTSPLTTKVGESTITAIFTPNFENGTVDVLLTIDTPSVNALSTNDDHQSTVITLSTEDSLRLGYIKKDGDKYIAGDKLPNGPLTTKVGESTITATFTPNFENGTVQVVLTVDTPSNN